SGVFGGSLTIDGTTVTANNADTFGGGVYVDPTAVTITSSTISGNAAPVGAGLSNLDSSVTISNSKCGAVAKCGTVTLIASSVGSTTNGSGGTVIDPAAEINNLIAQVAGLNLTADQKAGLTSKLQAAQQSLANANTTAA